MTGIIIAIVIIVLILAFIFGTYNSLVQLRNKVQEAFSTMDVYLKKRWDLIPNLVETVKGYASHESKTLEQVTNLRSKSYSSLDQNEKVDVNNELTSCINKLLAVAENYPDLKANENFLNLSAQLTGIEGEIANSRKYYNATVRDLNNKVQMFPSNIIAGMFGFKEAKMFEANEQERENVKVQF